MHCELVLCWWGQRHDLCVISGDQKPLHCICTLMAPKPSGSSPLSPSWFEQEADLGSWLGKSWSAQRATERSRPWDVPWEHRVDTDVRPDRHRAADQLLMSISKFTCLRYCPWKGDMPVKWKENLLLYEESTISCGIYFPGPQLLPCHSIRIGSSAVLLWTTLWTTNYLFLPTTNILK